MTAQGFRSVLAVLLISALVLLLSSETAFALDYYVDAELGSDVNSGLSPDDPLLTITHALECLESNEATPATIHIAAGTYSERTNGETFPLCLTTSVRLIGEGSGSTTVIGKGDVNIITCLGIDDLGIQGLKMDASNRTKGACLTVKNPRHVTFRDLATLPGASSIWLNPPNQGKSRCAFEVEDCVLAGAMFASCTAATIRSSTLGLTGLESGDVCVEDCTFVGGAFDGGLSFSACPSAAVRRCEITGYVESSGSNMTVEKCRVDGSIMLDYSYSDIYRNVVIDDSLIVGDSVVYSGAGVVPSGVGWDIAGYIAPSGSTLCTTSLSSSMTDAMREENTISGPSPEAQRVEAFTLRMDNCTIDAHLAGIRVTWRDEDHKKQLFLSSCKIVGSEYDGISVCGDPFRRGEIDLRNCLLHGNDSMYGRTVGFSFASSATIEGCTIADNPCGGMYLYSSRLAQVRNCIVRNPGVGVAEENTDLAVEHCCVEGGYDGEGNIDANPLFTSGPLGDYYLSSVAAGQVADSPCIDAGSGTPADSGVAWMTTTTDNAPDTGSVDIGYHYPGTPPTIECAVGTVSSVTPGADEAPRLVSGNVLRAELTVANEGPPIWVDVYAGFVCSDGTILSITPSGGLAEGIEPLATDELLDEGIHFGPHPVLEYEITSDIPTGDYTFAATLSPAREPFHPIGDLATQQFTIASAGEGRGSFPPEKKAEEMREKMP